MKLRDGFLLQSGKYRIVRFINSGGFGCTYEAVHSQFNSRVAIKEFFVKDFCNRDVESSQVTVATKSSAVLVERLRQKFIEEARAVFSMQHSNIVRVIDVFEENGTAYFVMDYIDGQSLQEMVEQRGMLKQEEALYYVNQIADALEYVHGLNRVHLDVKPGNIMVDKNHRAILIDFGASKQYDEVNGQNTSTLVSRTPGYAPAEQMGYDVVRFKPATDIYSLGATLYKLLSGRTPVSSTRRSSGEPLAPLAPSVDPVVAAAIYSAMEPSKDRRPQTIADFRRLLTGSGSLEMEVVVADEEIAAQSHSGAATGQPVVEPLPATQNPMLNNFQVGHKPMNKTTPSNKNTSGGKSWIGLVLGIVGGMSLMMGVLFALKKCNGSGDSQDACHVMPADSLAAIAVSDSGDVEVVDVVEEPVSELVSAEASPAPSHPRDDASARIATARASVSDVEARGGASSGGGATVARRATARVAIQTTGTLNGHDWVDLGLSVKWASCNVGATTSTQSGGYFTWGETSTKSEYTQDNCATWGYYYDNISGVAKYDVATSKWGNGWRMPSRDECQELIDKCSWEWTGSGYRVTGANGNSIFMPASGLMYGDDNLFKDRQGIYWTSISDGSDNGAYDFSFSEESGSMDVSARYRYDGLTIRAVCD